jgi:hypothetical protein
MASNTAQDASQEPLQVQSEEVMRDIILQRGARKRKQMLDAFVSGDRIEIGFATFTLANTCTDLALLELKVEGMAAQMAIMAAQIAAMAAQNKKHCNE